MLSLAAIKKKYEGSGRPIAEQVPWMMFATENMVLNKDGGLMVCYRYKGMDVEGLQRIDSDRHAMIAEHALRVFNERITLWWTVDRRRTTIYPEGDFPDPISAGINDDRRGEFANGDQYINKHSMSVLYAGQGHSANGFLDAIGYFSTVEGHGFIKSVWEAFKVTFLKRSAFATTASRLDAEVSKFEEMLAAFDETVSELGLRRMDSDELLGYLHDRCSPATNGQPVSGPNIPVYLDGWISDNTLDVYHDLLLFDDHEPVYVAAASVKGWPDWTYPGLLDGLLAVPGEITISQCFRYADPEEAKKYIKGMQTHNLNSQKGILTYLKEALTNTESDKRDNGRVIAAADAGEALTSMASLNRAFGYYNLTVLSYGMSAEEANETIKYASQYLRQNNFLVVREKLHLLSAWAGTLPGQWAELVRWFFIHTANLADLCPLRTLSAGDIRNDHLSEQTGRECPSLTALSTEYSVPFYFNFHNGDLAHTMVIGPSRSGKSVFDNFLISQFRKYHPCRIYIFDKDYSCKIPTLLQGGQYLDMTGEGADIKLNPLLLLDDKEAWPWLAQWMEILLTARGYPYTAEAEAQVWRAFENMSRMDKDQWRLRTLATGLLSKELTEQLQQWVSGGALAKYFDNLEDQLDLGNFSAMEMGGLFQNPRLSSAFMEYAFYRIQKSLDGTPTLIYIEEAWFMLSDERFTAKINDWLRTLAKKNAFLVMATQSLDEIANSEIFATIIDNIPNKIFLPNNNANAHYDLYTKKFGLNGEQVERIRNAIPKLNYYIVTPKLSRMAVARFTPHVLACLRSDSLAQAVFRKHYATGSGKEGWEYDYINELVAA